MILTTVYNVDISRPLLPTPLQQMLITKDKGANRIAVNLFDGRTPFAPGGSCVGFAVRRDGLTVPIENGVVSGSQMYIDLPADAYALEGPVNIGIKNVSGGTETTVFLGLGVVSLGETDAVIDPGTIIPSVSALIAEIQAATATIPADYSALLAAIAPTYSASATYKAGQPVWYSGTLYRAKQDIATAESWTAAHWEAVVVGTELRDIKSAIGVETYSNWVSSKAYATGGDTITPGSPSTNNQAACMCLSCTAGDVFTYNLYNDFGSSNIRHWAFYDSNGDLLKKASGNNGRYKNVEVTAPTGAAYIIFNVSKASIATCIVYKGRLTENLLAEKQNILTFDDTPTQNSANPVKSGGVYAAEKPILDAIGEHDELISATYEIGYYWNSQGTAAVKTALSTWRAYDPIEVLPGEKYKVYGYDGSSSKQYMALVVDAEYGILTHYGDRTDSHKTHEFVIPENGAYILLTTKRAYSVTCYKTVMNTIPTDVYAGRYNFAGKNIAIIGDSISTNGDYSASNNLGNVPEIVIEEEDVGVELSAYVTYYDIGTTVGGHEIVEADVGTELTFTPVEGDIGKIVGKPKNNNAASIKTWWEVAQDVLSFNVIPVCWSGSSITDHEENVQDNGHYIYKCAHSFHPSQIRKCGIRTPGTMNRTAPDMIIIYRGTNDLSHSPYAHITNYMDSFPTAYPEADTYDDGGVTKYDYAKGMRMLIKALRDAYPAVKIVLCTLNYFRRLSTTAKWTSNGTDNWQEYNDTIRKIAAHEGCELIDFAKDGLNWANAADGYYNEGSSSTAHWTHPNTKGHKVLGNRALRDMQSFNSMT